MQSIKMNSIEFFDLNKSYVHNYSDTPNSWTTKCLSITDHENDGITALSCDCLNEDVALMNSNADNTSIFKGGGKFYTLHNKAEWFRQVNQSIEDTVYFHSGNDPLPSINNILGSRTTYDINSELIQKELVPIAVHAIKESNSLDFRYSKPFLNWHQHRGSLANIPIIFSPGKGGKSTLHIPRNRKPNHTFTLEHLNEYWDSDNATINKIPINYYLCAIAMKNKNIYFPLRYVNMGCNYIQPISGTIAISNGITGSIAFAYDFVTNKLISEFSLRCHMFKTPYLASAINFVVPIDLERSQIYLYTFDD